VLLEEAAPEAVADRVAARLRSVYRRFKRCPACERAYWEGRHFERMRRMLERLGRDDLNQA
jgi:uncharacterized protein with PIN domain